MLHLVGCLYYLYQWCTVKQISDNEIYFLIKYIKCVLWRLAKRLSYIGDAWCQKVNAATSCGHFFISLFSLYCYALKIRPLPYFEMSEYPHPMTQRHIAQGLIAGVRFPTTNPAPYNHVNVLITTQVHWGQITNNTNQQCVEKKNQLDVTECFIALMICSKCFGHFYAHH